MLFRTLFITSLIIGVMCVSLCAQAAEYPRVISQEAQHTALSIYPDNLALITETRIVDLPQGRSTIVFEDISDRMIPASVLLRAFSGFTLERNFNYALLSKGSLFDKSVGETVTLTRTDKKNGVVRRQRAKILSAKQGVVFDIEGRVEVFQCSGLSEGTLFENLPQGLNDVPELSIDVSAKLAGPQEIVISYLADHFSWEADYRLDLDKGQTAGGLSAWITLRNNTAKSFKDAPTVVIAGQLNRSGATYSVKESVRHFQAQCWPLQSTQTPIDLPKYMYSEQQCYDGSYVYSGGALCPPPAAPMLYASYGGQNDEIIVTGSRKRDGYVSNAPTQVVAQEDLGDYKLYRMAEPITVAAYQTKQIRFLKKPNVKVDKIYTHEVNLSGLNYNYDEDENASVLSTLTEYRIDNEKGGALAKPLPKGIMRVLTRNDAGKLLVVGETNVRDTPIGIPMKVKMGEASLVQVHETVAQRRVRKKGQDGQYKITLYPVHTFSNASDVAVRVEVKIVGEYLSLNIGSKSHEHDEAVGANAWALTIPAESTTTLKYRASYID